MRRRIQQHRQAQVGQRAGGDDRTTDAGNTRGLAGALLNSSDAATGFPNTNNGRVVSGQQIQGPNTFSYEVWFRTNTTTGGKIVGFGNAASGNSNNYDRHLYMEGNGRVTFGVWTGQSVTVSSGTGLNDNQWHQAVATMGPGGLTLYIDGRRVGANTSTAAPSCQSPRVSGSTSTSARVRTCAAGASEKAVNHMAEPKAPRKPAASDPRHWPSVARMAPG